MEGLVGLTPRSVAERCKDVGEESIGDIVGKDLYPVRNLPRKDSTE